MTTQLSNHYLFQKHSGNIDWDNDSFKICLMATGFTFIRDTHATWADVSASELADGNGYTQNTKTLPATPTVSEDDTNDRSDVTFSADTVWTAASGSIGPSPGAIIYDDTSSDDTIVGYIDFGSDKTATDGNTFTISGITIRDTGA